MVRIEETLNDVSRVSGAGDSRPYSESDVRQEDQRGRNACWRSPTCPARSYAFPASYPQLESSERLPREKHEQVDGDISYL
jgi:hypothetical protein